MADPVRRWALRVTGVVQGVGFRPFVTATGRELCLTGLVGNDSDGVFIEAQGPVPALAELARRLREQPPPLAFVERVDVHELPVAAEGAGDGNGPDPGASGWRIVASTPGPGVTTIPPDTAVCDECLAEMRDPADRRFGYPFIACTNCGPRFTITTGLPYDRPGTTMAGFPLCPACRAEYTDPTSRRYHAQPTACPDCGPTLAMPVPEVVGALGAGRIVAIKGVGGYHLACDARDRSAVAVLRERKQRGAKPFAVMAADLATAGAVAEIDHGAAQVLTSRARPIVIAGARDLRLASDVAPGTATLGVMLPNAPLHHLLFDAGAPSLLVMTSGNLADEPICIDPDEAEERLGGIADVFCHHDRRIHVPCDDSVIRVARGTSLPVRRSRGYAPTPVPLPVGAPPLLAVGGELKATICLATGARAWLSQHIGDTANLETLAMLSRTADTMAQLQGIVPSLIVSDAHPGYLSHSWAAERAASRGVEHVVVGHHHAHLAALLAEHRVPAGEPVLGLVLDGTGYGADATIWGGELLLGSYESVARVGHLGAVPLPGGDAAIRHPARVALAHLWQAGIPWTGTASEAALSPSERRLLARMLDTGSHCTATTSMGRLFDAIASLLGVRHEITYEAQAAIELEARASAAERPAPGWSGGAQSEGVVGTAGDGAVVIDPAPWLARAVADRRTGVSSAASALGFHLALADALSEAAATVARRRAVGTVGLSGGVFGNAVLTSACQRSLRAAGLRVLTHSAVPPNDGGLALGQAAVAAARWPGSGP